MEILDQIRYEINLAEERLQPWFSRYEDFLLQYVNQDKDNDVIHVNTLYSIMQSALAVEQSDELTVVMMPRRTGDEEYAQALTELAQFDYGLMRLKQKKFQRNWDKWFFGISYMRNKGWNKYDQCIEPEVIDPMLHLDDPHSDHLTPSRFEYDIRRIHKDDLKEEFGFKNKEEVNGEIDIALNTMNANDIAHWLLTSMKDSDYVDVYDGATYIDWELHIVTVDASKSIVLRKEKVEALNDKEKTEGVPMTRIYNKVWLSPKRHNSRGISLCDISADKQKVNRVLLNLRLTDAKFNTFWQINLVNSRVVKNHVDLTEPSIEPKWVVANVQQWDRLSDAVYTVPRQSIMADSYNVSNEIAQIIQQDTWFDARTLGVPWDKSITLGEAQQIQTNANLRLSLGIEIGNWWEVDFWKDMWYAGYVQYFDKKDKKFIRVTRWLSTTATEFTYDRFMSWEMYDFYVESKKDIESRREKMKTNFMAIYAMMLQDPTTKQYEKILLKRTAYYYNWFSKDEAEAFCMPTADELNAKKQLKYLNEGMKEGLEVESMAEDHYTYLYIFQGCRNEQLRDEAIEIRKRAIMIQAEQWQSPEMPVSNTGAANSLVANTMSQNKPVQSLNTLT